MAEPKVFTTRVDVFFDDLDAFDMVYHGRYPALLEHGVTSLAAGHGVTLGHEDMNVVVRELALTYDLPITKIGQVDLELWVSHIGTSSATYGFRFRTGETVHAHGHRSVVKIDPRTKRPTPWSEFARQVLAGYLAPTAMV